MLLDIDSRDFFTITVNRELFERIFIQPQKVSFKNLIFKNRFPFDSFIQYALERLYSFKDKLYIVLLDTTCKPEFLTFN